MNNLSLNVAGLPRPITLICDSDDSSDDIANSPTYEITGDNTDSHPDTPDNDHISDIDLSISKIAKKDLLKTTLPSKKTKFKGYRVGIHGRMPDSVYRTLKRGY